MKKAIFIDKDGTLIHNVHYNANPDLVRLTDGALEGLKTLTSLGFEIFVVSNQQGIALGYFTDDDLKNVRQKLDELLGKHGIHLSGFYYCPHHKNDNCQCRKPNPALLTGAAKHHQINMKKSWMIGDVPADILAGKNAGCRTILFDKGYENMWHLPKESRPDYIVKGLDEAAAYIRTYE